MTRSFPLAFAALVFLGSGCSWFWPSMVRPDRNDAEVFRSGFPLVGGARTDGAVCSLATVGPDAMSLVSAPEAVDAAVPLGDWCASGEPARPGQHGRVGRLVVIEGKFGRARGYLFAAPDARGLLVAFSGLGMPAAGWVNERFAELAAVRGLATFAPVRDESARPFSFDPLREARNALGAAFAILDSCGFRERRLSFVGVSMGGMEALLAKHEAPAELAPRVAVLDPLLDPAAVADHLDGFWHSFATDSMQAYFRRILQGRYGESRSTSFHEMLNRSPEGTQTVLARHAPSEWLCGVEPATYSVFLSDRDPVLGHAQADFARRCKFPLRRAGAKGHVGLACRPDLFEEMLDAVAPAPKPRAGEPAVKARPSARTRGSGRTAPG